MQCTEVNVKIPFTVELDQIEQYCKKQYPDSSILRFITIGSDKNYLYANLLISTGCLSKNRSIFSFNKREFHNQNKFNACFLIPTGIGCEIGGHAGDGTAVLKMISSVCDKVVTHPNVVNASDINEMPHNSLYVEGSHLTQFLMGTIGLSKVKQNRILAVIASDPENNKKFEKAAINSVNGARAVLGITADIVVLDSPIYMEGCIVKNKAIGQVDYLDNLYTILSGRKSSYDAVAITSKIHINQNLHKQYSQSNGEIINPWGAAEAMLTHFVSSNFMVPSAHAPMLENNEIAEMDLGVVDSRIAPEVVSTTFFYCVLKGLNKAPKIISNTTLFNHSDIISVKDISALIIPDGTLGLPVLAAFHQGIKVIAVKNKNSMQNNLSKLPWRKGQFYQCENYLEATGLLNCFKAGLNIESVQRPLKTLKMQDYKTPTLLDNNVVIKKHLHPSG